jgi:hypothetical protein
VQVAERLDFAGALQRPGVDGAHAGVGDDAAQRLLGIGVIGGDENVERVAGDAALDEGAGERRVERLDDLRPGSLGCDLLRGGPGLERKRLERLDIDRVRETLASS